MRILRVRRGFQADHSSSSYLFYAVDRPVSAAGRKAAHRYSSRAEVDDRYARYVKWGGGELNPDAYKTLLDEHYDVMAEESYDWWTLTMMVPKTRAMKAALADFVDARDADGQGVEVEEYRRRIAVTVHCQFEGNGVEFATYDDEPHDKLVELLAKIRGELIAGDTSFLEAVAAFYGAFDEDDDEASDEDQGPLAAAALDAMSKAELQEQCEWRALEYRKSWTKARLREALAEEKPAPRRGRARKRRPKVSLAAQTILNQMERL